MHPVRLDHVTTEVFEAPEDFAGHCGRVFRGAEITSMYRALAVNWCAPTSRTAR